MRATPIVLGGLLCCACSNAELYGIDTEPNIADRISLRGELCTEDPSAVNFPVKVLVTIDGTAQIGMADPNRTRAAALRALVDRYSGTNYHFGFIQFASQARHLTGGFARDVTLIAPAIDTVGIGTAEAQRNWLDALRASATAVQDDILASTPGTRSRTRYVIFFITAGPPTPALQTAWCPSHGFNNPGSQACRDAFTAEFCGDIVPAPADCESALYQQSAAALRAYALEHGAEDVVFNTFALTADPRANELLTQISFASQGAFSQQLPDGLNLLRTDIAASSSVLLQRSLVVYNPNMVLVSGQPSADSDGDGLTDEQEQALGTDALRGDTDLDFVGDAIELRLAAPGLMFDPVSPRIPEQCAGIDPPDRDGDADGLNDCEEALLRTDPSLVDSDKDGLPDLVEVRRGSNPLDDDLLRDSDRDGVPNGIAVREGLSALGADARFELERGYRYRITDMGVSTRYEAVPHEPLEGIQITRVTASAPTVGALLYSAGPPARLAFASDLRKGDFGPSVDVSRGGSFELPAAGQPGAGGGADLGGLDLGAPDASHRIDVRVLAAALPPPATRPPECPSDRSIPCDALVQVLIRPTVRSCFHFDVRNISLASTQAVPGGRPGAGWNDLRVYLGQQPKASPNGFLIFDQATVPVRFVRGVNGKPDEKVPNRPYVTLDQFSFVLLEGTP